MTNYKKAMEIDSQERDMYYNFSISKKTEQQKALEKILIEKNFAPHSISDVAFGGGG